MKSNIILSIQHLKKAHDNMELFCRTSPNTMGARVFKRYLPKLVWIYEDIITRHEIPPLLQYGIKLEWQSDVYAPDEITSKIPLLSNEERLKVEEYIDNLLKIRDTCSKVQYSAR